MYAFSYGGPYFIWEMEGWRRRKRSVSAEKREQRTEGLLRKKSVALLLSCCGERFFESGAQANRPFFILFRVWVGKGGKKAFRVRIMGLGRGEKVRWFWLKRRTGNRRIFEYAKSSF